MSLSNTWTLMNSDHAVNLARWRRLKDYVCQRNTFSSTSHLRPLFMRTISLKNYSNPTTEVIVLCLLFEEGLTTTVFFHAGHLLMQEILLHKVSCNIYETFKSTRKNHEYVSYLENRMMDVARYQMIKHNRETHNEDNPKRFSLLRKANSRI